MQLITPSAEDEQVVPVELCAAVALQLAAFVAVVARTAVTVTFCEGVKPFSGDPTDATPAKYVPFESAAKLSSYVARLRRSDFIAATYAFSFVFENFGIAIAARMPMMTTTMRSSISVKPFLLRTIVHCS